MDFVTRLSHTIHQHDSIWIIVDQKIKLAYFLPVKTSDTVKDYTKMYIYDLVRIYGIPLSIIQDRVKKFTSQFWESFLKGLGTKVKLSKAFYPK